MGLRDKVEAILTSGSRDNRRPILKKGNESNIKGLHIVGDLAGAPVIKLAMAQAVELIDYLSTLPEMQDRGSRDVLDIAVIGAGAAGLNAALAAQEKGFSFVVLEKNRIANTIEVAICLAWIRRKGAVVNVVRDTVVVCVVINIDRDIVDDNKVGDIL